MPEPPPPGGGAACRGREREEQRLRNQTIDDALCGGGGDDDKATSTSSSTRRRPRRCQGGLGEPEAADADDSPVIAAEFRASASFPAANGAAAAATTTTSRRSASASASTTAPTSSAATAAAAAPSRLLPALRRLPPGWGPAGGLCARAGVRRSGDAGRRLVRETCNSKDPKKLKKLNLQKKKKKKKLLSPISFFSLSFFSPRRSVEKVRMCDRVPASSRGAFG